MIKNVRNWWVELDVDGRATRTATGPRKPNGGFDVTVFQRDGEDPVVALTVSGIARQDGTLTLKVQDKGGKVIHTFKTDRIQPNQMVE